MTTDPPATTPLPETLTGDPITLSPESALALMEDWNRVLGERDTARAEVDRLTRALAEGAERLTLAERKADHWRKAYKAVGLVLIDFMAQHHRRALNLGAGGCDCELCRDAREKGIRPATDPAYRAARPTGEEPADGA